MSNATDLVRQRGEHQAIWVVGDLYIFLATAAETDGAYALWLARIAPGGGPPLHVHANEDERFDVLTGDLSLWIGEEKTVLSAGCSAVAPRGTPHRFQNETGEIVEALIHVTPGGFERYLMAIGVPALDLDCTPPPPTPEQIARLEALAPEYGIEIL